MGDVHKCHLIGVRDELTHLCFQQLTAHNKDTGINNMERIQ